MSPRLSIDRDAVSAFCIRHHIKRLALFGSVLRADVGPGRWIEFGTSVALFRFVDPQQLPTQRPSFDVTADGQRFIVSSIERRTDPSIDVLVHWPALLTAQAAR